MQSLDKKSDDKMATRYQIQFDTKKKILMEILPELTCYNCGATPEHNNDEDLRLVVKFCVYNILKPNYNNIDVIFRYKCFLNGHSLCRYCNDFCKCGSEVGDTPHTTQILHLNLSILLHTFDHIYNIVMIGGHHNE